MKQPGRHRCRAHRVDFGIKAPKKIRPVFNDLPGSIISYGATIRAAGAASSSTDSRRLSDPVKTNPTCSITKVSCPVLRARKRERHGFFLYNELGQKEIDAFNGRRGNVSLAASSAQVAGEHRTQHPRIRISRLRDLQATPNADRRRSQPQGGSRRPIRPSRTNKKREGDAAAACDWCAPHWPPVGSTRSAAAAAESV